MRLGGLVETQLLADADRERAALHPTQQLVHSFDELAPRRYVIVNVGRVR